MEFTNQNYYGKDDRNFYFVQNEQTMIRCSDWVENISMQ
jgi:hypothetical protein